ncbi:MAG: UDP-N-acetylmuramoyl-L-alanyl-D-glutamate--2,6-diaminopimelate ligase [Amphritea sp.]
MRMQPQFTLQQLLMSLVPADQIQDVAELMVTGICLDSRKVEPGDLFFARTGVQHKGIEFVEAAASNGAVAAIVSREELAGVDCNRSSMPVIGVEDIDGLIGRVASRFYGEPSRQLKMIGITGTNGKTSCSHYVAQALESAGETSALIGTVGNGLLGRLEAATHTTPDAISLQALLAELLAKGATAVVMEVSSHALDQQRVAGVEFDVAGFTNLSRDHLDYHGDMNSYGAAKAQLFTAMDVPYLVINRDDSFGEKLVEQIAKQPLLKPLVLESSQRPRCFSFGEQPDADIVAWQITLSTDGICAQIDTPWGTLGLKTGLIGRFNLSNLLLTIGVIGQLGLSREEIETAVNGITAVPGRMQIVMHSRPLVVVDYAHTPDALEKALLALNSHCNGRLWCVFGCGGDRDTGKRPEMGAIAAHLADSVVVTSDNPRSEDPERIIAMIMAGIESDAEVTSISNREQAIEHATAALAENDILLIAGKGHETYQEVKGVRMPFDDVEIARQALAQRAVG